MTLNKRVGFGNTLGCDPLGGTSYVVLGSIVDGFSGPDCKAVEANTSLLSDWFHTSAPASVDPGNVTFVIAYDPAFSESHTLAALLASGALATWQVTYYAVSPGTAQVETFTGYVAGMGRETKKENMVTCPITIRISGNPGFKTS